MRFTEFLRERGAPPRPRRGASTLTVPAYDGYQPDGYDVEPFAVGVEYELEAPSYSDHPGGRERHPGSVTILALTALEPVRFADPETGKIVKTAPRGADLEKLPGWAASDTAYFQRHVEEETEE